MGAIVLILASLVALSAFTTNSNQIQITKSTQDEIAASVVNIYCPSTTSKIEGSGGSGTIMSQDGIILTNSHIIPQDKINIFVEETGCLVILPDPITGQAKEMYLAHPIVLPDISDKYDLAFYRFTLLIMMTKKRNMLVYTQKNFLHLMILLVVKTKTFS